MKIKPYLGSMIGLNELVKIPVELREGCEVNTKNDILNFTFVKDAINEHPNGWHLEINYGDDIFDTKYLMHVDNKLKHWHPICVIENCTKTDARKLRTWFKFWLHELMEGI